VFKRIGPRKGTGIFQWLLTLGIAAAALIGLYFSNRVDEVCKMGDADKLFAFKDVAWRGIFWVSLPPGILFVIGSFMVPNRRGGCFAAGTKTPRAPHYCVRAQRSRRGLSCRRWKPSVAAENAKSAGTLIKESLLRRKYVIPFVLACIILAATNSPALIPLSATMPRF